MTDEESQDATEPTEYNKEYWQAAYEAAVKRLKDAEEEVQVLSLEMDELEALAMSTNDQCRTCGQYLDESEF